MYTGSPRETRVQLEESTYGIIAKSNFYEKGNHRFSGAEEPNFKFYAIKIKVTVDLKIRETLTQKSFEFTK